MTTIMICLCRHVVESGRDKKRMGRGSLRADISSFLCFFHSAAFVREHGRFDSFVSVQVFSLPFFTLR